jgi:hypothetical protein
MPNIVNELLSSGSKVSPTDKVCIFI